MALHYKNYFSEGIGKIRNWILLFLWVILLSSGCIANAETPANEEKGGRFNVMEYKYMTSQELIQRLGKPDSVIEGSRGEFEVPCVYIEYRGGDLGEVEFTLVNDKVVHFVSYKERVYVEDHDEMLMEYGINVSDDCVIVADTGVALRFRHPSDEVDDFWINNISTNGTFETLSVTFDMYYFEEWYLPLSTMEEIMYKSETELLIKSILVSPQSARFPWYEWEYTKNLFYIGVASYVEADNIMGISQKSDFCCIYSLVTEEPVLLIVNNEVILNNGYISTEELVMNCFEDLQNNVIAEELITSDMNEFFVHYILPQYVVVEGDLLDSKQYDSNESTNWCYKLEGRVANGSYEAMVYPFQMGSGNEITDLWIEYLYWNGELIIANDQSELLDYSPRKYVDN